MDSIWDDIYLRDTMNVVKVFNLHENLMPTQGTHYDAYVYSQKYIVYDFGDFWEVSIFPRYIPMSSFDINKFQALCWQWFHTYPQYVEPTQHGVIIRSVHDNARGMIAHMVSTLHHPSNDNQWWKRFNVLRSHIALALGGEMLHSSAAVMPFFIDENKGSVGISTPYGEVLFAGKRDITPVYVSTVSHVSFPQSHLFFTDDENDYFNSTNGIWVDKDGVNVYVHDSTSALSIAQSIKKVVGLRIIPVEERYDVVPYHDKVAHPHVADISREMRFSPVYDKMLLPERYIHPYSSGIDYSSAVSLTQGVYR